MPPNNKQTKNEKREQARQEVRNNLAKQATSKARKKLMLKIGLGIILPIVVIAIGLIVFLSQTKNSTQNANVVVPSNGVTRGVIIGEGDKPVPEVPVTPVGQQKTAPAHVVIYQDYICPGCKAFEENFSSEISKMINDGSAVVEYRTVSFLDSMSSGTNYSSRAANVSYCVLDAAPESFFAFNALLYANQPAEMSRGLTNADMIKLAGSLGIDKSKLESCVKDGTYRGFVADNNKAALKIPIAGTPTIMINDVEWDKQGSLYDAVEKARTLLTK